MQKRSKTPFTTGSRKAAPAISDATRDKLLEAAGRVFAERGYEAATVREICVKAGANVAAVNYHFRDKAGLYVQVLQYSMRAAQVEAIRHTLTQDAPPEEILRAVIKLRLQGICRGVPGWHFRIMAREMAQPTPAMSNIIKRVSVPMYRRMLELVASILGLSPEDETTKLCAHSILGQIFIYAAASPVLLRLWPDLRMTPQQVERIADHIADFSLAYLRQFRTNRGPQGAAGNRSTRREKE